MQFLLFTQQPRKHCMLKGRFIFSSRSFYPLSAAFVYFVPNARLGYRLMSPSWAERNATTVSTGQKWIACCTTLREQWNSPSILHAVPKFNYRRNADWDFHYSGLTKGQRGFANVHFLLRQHFIRCSKRWNNYISSWINNWFYNSPFRVLLWDPTWIFYFSSPAVS